MTRICLVFVSLCVAGVIGLAPQKETGAAFQPAPVKTRSLSTVAVNPAQSRLVNCALRGSDPTDCKGPLPGTTGPRG